MALFRIRSAATYGIDAHLIDVEVDMYPGSDRDFITVGMPDTAVRESRERIKSALINSGFGYPSQSVTINLATANVRKEGAGFDLPMALGILGAMGRVASTDDHLFVGELSLDGAVRPARGALSIAACARKKGSRILSRLPKTPPRRQSLEACASSESGIWPRLSVCSRIRPPSRHMPARPPLPRRRPARPSISRCALPDYC